MYVYDSTKKETVNMEKRNLKDAEPQETFALRNTKSLRAQLESFFNSFRFFKEREEKWLKSVWQSDDLLVVKCLKLFVRLFVTFPTLLFIKPRVCFYVLPILMAPLWLHALKGLTAEPWQLDIFCQQLVWWHMGLAHWAVYTASMLERIPTMRSFYYRFVYESDVSESAVSESADDDAHCCALLGAMYFALIVLSLLFAFEMWFIVDAMREQKFPRGDNMHNELGFYEAEALKYPLHRFVRTPLKKLLPFLLNIVYKACLIVYKACL